MNEYIYQTGALSVLETGQTTTAGQCWLINPVGSGKRVKLKRVTIQIASATATAAAAIPALTLQRVTFTGTASGASVSAVKVDSRSPSAVGSVRTASTGLTLASVGSNAQLWSTFAPGIVDSAKVPGDAVIDAEIEVSLAEGEGIVLQQVGNGVANDTRRYVVRFETEEAELWQ